MLTMIEHFDCLTEQGLKVIPLRQNSKVPIGKCWQKDWDLNKNRKRLQIFPDANIGLVLGEVIDVEGDSEHANDLLSNLIGDYPHPSYRSTRSVHHLFRTPDPDLRLVKHDQIEFRGHGHQSVLPPSQHFGVEYRWVTELFPVPEMPSKLLKFYEHLIGKRTKIKSEGIKVWCSVCRNECYLHQKRFQLELDAFKLFGSQWECQKCRSLDMRPIVRAMKQK